MNRNRVFILLIIFSLFSCARGSRPRYPKPPPGSREPPVTDAVKQTPERVASNALIEEGKQALDHGLYDHSSDLFQESVKVDPSNGVGYYYLALVKLRTGEYGEVTGFLEKAELLLSGDKEWVPKLEGIRAELHQNKPNSF